MNCIWGASRLVFVLAWTDTLFFSLKMSRIPFISSHASCVSSSCSSPRLPRAETSCREFLFPWVTVNYKLSTCPQTVFASGLVPATGVSCNKPYCDAASCFVFVPIACFVDYSKHLFFLHKLEGDGPAIFSDSSHNQSQRRSPQPGI